MRLYSPSSINVFMKCPRLYYYKYIKNIPTLPNINLYKGSIIHEVLETIFKSNKHINLSKESIRLLNFLWNPGKEGIILPKFELELHKKELCLMLKNFSITFENKIKLAILDKKVSDKNHAWNLLKPRKRELEIVNEDLQLKGIIDCVEQDFDDRTFIIDYKTSKKFHDLIPQDYIRQVSLYALLYKKKYGKNPDYVGINYLRYGETYFLPVSDAMIDEALNTLEYVKRNTISQDIKDYPLEGDKFGVQECLEIEKNITN